MPEPTRPRIRTRLWSQEVAEADPEPESKAVYEFPCGRNFYDASDKPRKNLDPKTNE